MEKWNSEGEDGGFKKIIASNKLCIHNAVRIPIQCSDLLFSKFQEQLLSQARTSE